MNRFYFGCVRITTKGFSSKTLLTEKFMLAFDLENFQSLKKVSYLHITFCFLSKVWTLNLTIILFLRAFSNVKFFFKLLLLPIIFYFKMSTGGWEVVNNCQKLANVVCVRLLIILPFNILPIYFEYSCWVEIADPNTIFPWSF